MKKYYKKLATLSVEARCRLDSAGAARLISGGRARPARHPLPVRQTDSCVRWRGTPARPAVTLATVATSTIVSATANKTPINQQKRMISINRYV